MANKYNWIITAEETSSLVSGSIYFVEENRWSTDKTQACTFPTKAKAESVAKTLSFECTVEKQ